MGYHGSRGWHPRQRQAELNTPSLALRGGCHAIDAMETLLQPEAGEGVTEASLTRHLGSAAEAAAMAMLQPQLPPALSPEKHHHTSDNIRVA